MSVNPTPTPGVIAPPTGPPLPGGVPTPTAQPAPGTPLFTVPEPTVPGAPGTQDTPPAAGTTTPAATTPPAAPGGATTPAATPATVPAMPGMNMDPATAKGGGPTATVAGGGPTTRSPLTTRYRDNELQTHHFGDARFAFPSINESFKSLDAPTIKWGPDWKSDGADSFVHTNGTKVHTSVVSRLVVSNNAAIKFVQTPFGQGRQMPDGTVVGIGKDGQPYKVGKDGQREPLDFGMHQFGKLRVRVFHVTRARVTTPDDRVVTYDSRNNVRFGRGFPQVMGGGPSAAATGAQICDMDMTTPDPAAAKGSDVAAAKGDPAPTKTTDDTAPPKNGGPPPLPGNTSPAAQAQTTALIKQMTDLINQLMALLASGQDPSSVGGVNGLGVKGLLAGSQQPLAALSALGTDSSDSLST